MATSQNNYFVFMTRDTTGRLPRLRLWDFGTVKRHAYLRDGSAGFLLGHFAHWYHFNIEPLDTGIWDEWGWAVRPVRGQSTGYSNHSSGTALDLDATKHPRGRATRATFTDSEIGRIHRQLLRYEGCIRWGGDYHNIPDGMHFEIDDDLTHVEKVARKLWQSKHGKPIIDANPGAASVIWDGNVPGTQTPRPEPEPKPVPTGGAIDRSYAKDKVDSAAVVRAGFRGVIGYLSSNPDKNFTRDEIDRHHRAGLWVMPVFEESAGRAKGDAALGNRDRAAAERQANGLGFRDQDAIFYAVDFDASWAQVRPYFIGLNQGNTHPVGIYGGIDVMVGAHRDGLASHFWQTSAWSEGHWAPYAQLRQITSHSRDIDGLRRTDWDENLIVPGPTIPVWNPGEAARAPEPKPPTGGGLKVVSATALPLGSSDHHAVKWALEFPSGQRWHTLQCNVQGTDPEVVSSKYVSKVFDETGLVTWNELSTTPLQNQVHMKEGWTSYMPGAVLSDDGKQVKVKSDSNQVVISWRTDVWEMVTASQKIVHKGVVGRTPVRVIKKVLLRHRESGETVWRTATHVVHHIEVNGKARVPSWFGQNGRAKTHFTLLAEDVVVSKPTAPLFGSGDLNVDFKANQRQARAGTGTAWFPYEMLGPVSDIITPQDHGPTHGTRLIDWGWLAQGGN